MGDTAATRETVVNGVVLALRYSALRGLADRREIRDILYIDGADCIRDGAVDLQVVWDLLAELPEFDPDAAAAPMFVVKSWEPHFGVDVRLPAHLQGATERDIAIAATSSAVPRHEVARALEPPEARARRRSTLLQFEADAPAPVLPDRAPTWRERREVLWAAVAVFLAAAGFVAFTLLRASGGGWQGIDAGAIDVGIPLAGAQRLGTQVSATLADTAWLQADEATRREQMEAALRAVDAVGADSFVLRDASGALRATAQWYGSPPRIRVKFY